MQMDDLDIRSWLRLLLTPGIGNDSAHRLWTRFGSIQGIFEASELQWSEVISRAQIEALHHVPSLLNAHFARTMQWLSAKPHAAHAQRAVWPLGDRKSTRLNSSHT